MADNGSGNSTLKIVAPIILAVISLIGVIVQTDWFAARMTPASEPVEQAVTQRVVEEVNEPETESPSAESATETATQEVLEDESSPTSTPVPLPLVEIFPQVGPGEDFDYVNNPATFTSEILNNDCVRSGVYGLRVIYDIKNSGSGGWGTLWVNAPNGTTDFIEYSELVFWVKGGTGTERFKVTVSDSLQQAKALDSTDLLVLSRDWQEVRIPLDNFGNVNFSLVTSLTFDFSAKNTGGQLCIDDISFE